MDRQFLKYVALVVSCLSCWVIGSFYSFNIYANEFRAAYNLTLLEANLAFSFGHLGLSFGFPAGIIFQHCGSLPLALISFVLPVSGLALLWTSTLYGQFYSSNYMIFSAFYFIIGHGSSYLYVASIIPNLINFRHSPRGLVIALLDGFHCIGVVPFILLFRYYFADATVLTSNDNVLFDFDSIFDQFARLPNYFLVLAGSFLLVSFLSALTVRSYLDDNETDTDDLTDNVWENVRQNTATAIEYPEIENEFAGSGNFNPDDENLVPVVGTAPKLRVIGGTGPDLLPRVNSTLSQVIECPDVTGLKDLLRRSEFYFLIGFFAIASAVSLTLIQNINVILQCKQSSHLITLYVICAALSNGFSRLFFHSKSDRFCGIPHCNLLFFLLIANVLAFAASIGFSYLFIVMILTICSGCLYGALYSVTPLIIASRYGLKLFGRIWGVFILTSAVSTMILQIVFGLIYQQYVTEGRLVCYDGIECYRWSFVTFEVMLLCAALFLNGFIQCKN